MLPIGNCNDIQYFGALHGDGSVSTLNLDTSNHNGLGLLLSKRFECHGVYQERRRGRKFFRLPRAKQSCSGLFHAEQADTVSPIRFTPMVETGNKRWPSNVDTNSITSWQRSRFSRILRTGGWAFVREC